jgi:hypothetical protein
MAIAFTDVSTPSSSISYGTLGPLKTVLKGVTFDNAYPTGGESFTLAQTGLPTFCLGGIIINQPTNAGGTLGLLASVQAATDGQTGTVKLYETGAVVDTPLDEVDSAFDPSLYTTMRILFLGY